VGLTYHEVATMLDTTSLRFQIDELERRQIFTSPLVKQMLDELEDCIRERDALAAYVVAQGDEIERLRKIAENQRNDFNERFNGLEQSVRKHSVEEHRLLIENLKLQDALGVKSLEAKEAHEVIHDIIATLEQCGMVSRHRLDVPI